MENSVTDKNINSDFLSQSYSQGIEKITGTKEHIVNFQVPKEVLENRIKTWNNLFDKYSEEMSDNIELNLKTLEPEDREEEEFSEEECSYGQRVPMRKPAMLVQYWINTGNTPYKAFLDKKELSESGSSLNEEEIISPTYSLLSNKVNESNKHKCESNTSSSSVDTAAYILSNANVTKKADTIAIIEGAKSNGVKSSENNCIENMRTVCNDRTNSTETVVTNHLIHNGGSNDILHNDTSHSILVENMASGTNDQLITSTVTSVNTVHPNLFSQNSLCDTINKPDVVNTSQKNADLHNIDDIVNIFQQFNETSKRLSTDDKSNCTLSEDKMLKEYSFSEKPVLENTAEENVRKDVNLVLFHRKKLYTGRNSPVDLILVEKNSSDMNKSKSPNTKLSLHPALDPDDSIKSESFTYKDKNKRYLSSKKSLSSKKVQGKKDSKVHKHSSVFNKTIISDETAVTNNNTLDPIVESSLQNVSGSSNNVDKISSDNLITDCNSTNVSMENIQKYPIVYLEKITSLKANESKSVKDKDITQENNMYNNSVALGSPVYKSKHSESIDSDQSTILICKCNDINVEDSSSISSSFHLTLSTEDECFVTNVEKKDDKLTNLKNDVNQNKKPLVILERLPQALIEKYLKVTQVLNINSDLPISSEKLPKKSKINSSHSRETNIKNDVKLREMKVILERLPADMYHKRSSSATSLSAVKNKISQHTSRSNNKTKFQNKIRNWNNRNRTARTIHKINNYSLRIRSRSKTNDDKMNNTSLDVAQHDNQISNGIESSFTSRCRNHNSQVRKNRRKTFSGLNFISSDEDDLVRFIQPKKKLKTLIDKTSKTHIAENDLYDEATIVNTNKNKYDSNRNISTTITYSSKQSNLEKIDRSIRERNRQNKAEVESDSNATSIDSSTTYKHKKFLSSPRKSNQCDSIVKNLNRRQKRYLFSNIKNMSNNRKRRLNKVTKKNGVNRRNDTYITLFQTKTFNTESSDSDITSTRKSLRIASTDDRARFSDHASNKEKLHNDSHLKMHANKQSNLLNSTDKYDATNEIRNARRKLRSAAETNERTNDKELISLHTNTATKTTPYLPVVSNTLMQEDNAILNASPRNNFSKLLRNRQVLEKPNLKNSQANQQYNIKSTVVKKNNLTFQTKSYYDSESSEY